MSKFAEVFESRGIARQYGATSAQRARSAFKTSCYACSTKGLQLECDKCGISVAHKDVMTILFNSKVV